MAEFGILANFRLQTNTTKEMSDDARDDHDVRYFAVWSLFCF